METAMGTERINVDALYRRYAPMVTRRCRQLLGNEDMAADAMQETFVRILQPGKNLHARYPSSLLYRIATNICLNMLRTNKRRPTVSADPFMESLAGRERMEDRILDSFVIEQVFSGSADGTRKAAEMLYLEGCTLSETARQVELSISGVRKRLRSLRERRAGLLAR
jgi:RNA polymerase sigma-70 factor (ECF subfamily)